MPAGGRQSAKHARLAGFLVEMHGLGVEFRGEFDDFPGRHQLGAEIERCADLEILIGPFLSSHSRNPVQSCTITMNAADAFRKPVSTALSACDLSGVQCIWKLEIPQGRRFLRSGPDANGSRHRSSCLEPDGTSLDFADIAKGRIVFG